MPNNFNIVKKPNKDIKTDDYDEYAEVQKDEKTDNKNQSDAKKRMFKFMVIICGVFIIIMLVLYLYFVFVGRTYSYEEIEDILKNAAISYFKDNESQLPVEEGGIVEIEVANLVAAEKMKDLSEYTEEGIACNGIVQVERTGSDYLYTPFLNCGDAYETMELYRKIISDKNIVTSGYGLYQLNGEYVYRGEDVNNYVKLDQGLWRIVKVNANNNVVLIKDEVVGNTLAWDNRYNENVKYNAGINNYAASRMKEFLQQAYSKPNEKLNEVFLSKSDKEKLVPFNLCVGKRSKSSNTNNNSLECSDILGSQKVGLLTLSEYMNASIDANCTSSESATCQNYNYLKNGTSFWLVTADKDTNYLVYGVGDTGKIELKNANIYSSARPVIYLNKNLLYKSGKGTVDKPYIIK